MIVAVVAVRVMQMATDAVIDVVAMRDRLVAAAGTVHMTLLVAAAAVVRGAAVRVVARDLDYVLVDMALMRMVKVPVVQIVDVAGMAYRGVAASRAMLVFVVAMLRRSAGGHDFFVLSVPRNRGHCGAALGRMIDRVADERRHVLVDQRVEDVLGIASALDKAHRVQRFQPRRYCRDVDAFLFCQFRDASLTAGEPHEQPQSLGIAERAKHRSRGLDLLARRKPNQRAVRMLLVSVHSASAEHAASIHRAMEYRRRFGPGKGAAPGQPSQRFADEGTRPGFRAREPIPTSRR